MLPDFAMLATGSRSIPWDGGANDSPQQAVWL